jgi:hypothetical protein
MVFDDSEFTCPACKRPFESDDIEAKKEELTINFNKSKTQELQKITSKGQSNARDIGRYNDILATTSVSIEELEKAIYVKQADYDGIIIPDAPTVACNPKINLLQNEIIEIEKSFIEIIPADNSKLLLEKKVAGMMLDEAKKLRTIKDENARHRNRLKILSAREQEVSQLIADLEKMWFQCENFSRAKVRMVEEKINSLFSIVKFKMFKTLVNGATEEICETLIEGVPYSDANNASRIQGGLDIINALSRHYDVYAPIWVDNRESVTKIPVMDCQVISLYVDSECAELKVVTEKELVETI